MCQKNTTSKLLFDFGQIKFSLESIKIQTVCAVITKSSERSENKRKRLEESDRLEDCELNYKVKGYLKDGMKARREKSFALPVKNESGRMVKNTRMPLETPEGEQNQKEVNFKGKKGKNNNKDTPLEMETRLTGCIIYVNKHY